jgi:hypothetical protein
MALTTEDAISTANGDPQRISTHDPIERFEEDLLGRSNFARLLARALVEYPQASSLVVALYTVTGAQVRPRR